MQATCEHDYCSTQGLIRKGTIMKYFILCTALMASSSSFAGGIDIGKAGATVCAGCHGMDGKSVAPGFPSLAGQDLTYLKNQLINFRSKSRLADKLRSCTLWLQV